MIFFTGFCMFFGSIIVALATNNKSPKWLVDTGGLACILGISLMLLSVAYLIGNLLP